MLRFILFADQLSAWFGKSFAWLVMLMTLGMTYEVVVRYIFNNPTPWAYELSFIMYGALFMVGGAYTLSRNGHVRGDFIYRMWPVRMQGAVDLVLYFLFFFPGVTALIFSGWKYAARSVRYGEVSASSPAGIPIYQFKAVMVLAGALLFIQGIAQVLRCILAIRDGQWHEPAPDVEETEILAMQERGEDFIHHPDHIEAKGASGASSTR